MRIRDDSHQTCKSTQFYGEPAKWAEWEEKMINGDPDAPASWIGRPPTPRGKSIYQRQSESDKRIFDYVKRDIEKLKWGFRY